MNRLKACRLLLAAFAICMMSFCGWSLASTFSGPFQITSIIVGGHGAHVAVSPNPSGCTTDWEGTQFVVIRERVNYKDLLAGLLAAQAQGKAIMVWHDPQGNANCGFGNQQIIDTIQIRN